MKKILFLSTILLSCFIMNAQTLYVKNTTNTYNLDVTNIKKYPVTCGTSSYCTMTDMTSILPGNEGSQAYPTTCASVPDIEMKIMYYDPFITIPQPFIIQYCGISTSGSFTGSTPLVKYDLYQGVGNDVVLYIHY